MLASYPLCGYPSIAVTRRRWKGGYMSQLIPGNQKHLSLKDREFIEQSLNDGLSFKEMAKYLCKDPTTISKEVKLHRSMDTYHIGSFNNPSNFCVHRYKCKKTNVCEKLFVCDRHCAQCSKCNKVCRFYEKERCLRLEKAPHVCNGCDKPRHHCKISAKYNYDAAFAQRKYEELRTSSREGINKTISQIHKIDAVVQPLVLQGQSPYHILINHPELDMSVKTMYNYINLGILTARNIDLKRKVKFKPRKTDKRKQPIKDREALNGRLYSDFQALGLSTSEFCEMDTVISAEGSLKCFLTLCLPDTEFFLAFLLNRCTEGAVRAVFDRLEQTLGTYDFLRLFSVCLTDRGSEFGDPAALETGIHGIERTSIYYCDPMSSGQKGAIEEAHTLLRMIIPKKTVFTDITQWDLRKCMNHINSTPRKALGGRTPFDLTVEKFGADIVDKLGIKKIAPDDVTLTPKLLRK